MKFKFLNKCLLVLGLFLFFTVIFPYPNVGNIMVAKAANFEQQDQNDIKLNVKSLALVKDTSFGLTVYNIKDSDKVTYKTSESSIASVDESGVITAVDFGSANITVTVKDGLKTIATLDCEVTVGPAALSIKLTKSDLTLSLGSKTTLTAILKPNNTVEEAKYSSNDSEIASVSVGGTVTAKVVGTTYIFASIANGKYDMCKVTVVEQEASKDTVQTQPSKDTMQTQPNKDAVQTQSTDSK
jgi:uncharacterized protein YjdB